jgi:oxygen-independent coproporphyrinogen-3 oxidase
MYPIKINETETEKPEECLPGIYIHVPFCHHKCGYCDFYSVTDLKHLDSYVAALIKEIQIAAEQWDGFSFDTVYFGGGTPSLLSGEQISLIISALNKYFEIVPGAEITLEANPGTLTENKLTIYRKAGVNRLSLGVQSFSDEELKSLDRIHNSGESVTAINLIRECGFENLSMDLMAALPGQSIEQLKRNLEQAISLKPEHISVYTLILEPDTPYWELHRQGKLKMPDEETETEHYRFLTEFLQSHEYEMYEISNFALSPKYYSRHNVKYWRYIPYLGLGPSAHSFNGSFRFSNARNLFKYIKQLNSGELPVDFEEELSEKTRMEEFAFLGLRLKEGIDKKRFKNIFQEDFEEVFNNFYDKFKESKYIIESDENIRLSAEGLFLCDEISAYLISRNS